MNRSFHRICISIFAVALVVLFLGHQAWSAEKELLDLNRALELAGANNPLISASREQIRQSEEQLNQAKAPLYPSLGLEFIYQKVGEEPLLPVYGTNGSYLGTAVNGFEDTYQAALTFTYLLYSGGAVKNNVQAKDLALEAIKAQAERTKQAVDNGVYSAYYELQRARARLIVAEEALNLAREHLREVELFYKNGVVAKNQVLRVQVEVSDSELNRISAANAVNVAWSALERAVGLPLKNTYRLPKPADTPGNFQVPEDVQAMAFTNRPELVSFEKSRLSALALSRAATGQGGPQVALVGEAYDLGDEFYPDKYDDWSITLSATWTFFDGGASKAKAAEAKAAADELLYRIEDLKRQIDLEISTAMLNLRSSGQRVSVAEDQVASAEEDYRMALRRYRAQVGTNIDVLDSRVALINARNQLVDSVYDVFQSRADLLYALGLDSYPLK
jgi:outer membrane protein TolC